MITLCNNFAMLTHKEIIAKWPQGNGGMYARFALDVNEPVSLVTVWNHRGRIPPRYWPVVIQSAKRRRIKGVTLDALAAPQTGGTV